MVEITDLLTPKSVLPHLKASCKKQALEALARAASDLIGLPFEDILDKLLERERLGSTGVGGGVAIPHGKVEGAEQLFGILARLDQPIEFEAVDDRPVDILFLLIAPEGAGAEHLKALARVSRLLRDRSLVDSLRGAESGEALYAIASEGEASHAA
ncbi:MAG: PTS IIA-like nitrogen regulatory protein PtsN [Pseudomonadota bacterium]